MNVANKVIVVTGGGSGIGRALTLALIERGARVAAVDLNEETLKETMGLAGTNQDRISLHVLNIADRDAVEALPQAVIDTHGAVDGLVNNAGIIQPFVKFNDLDHKTIERVINVNLYGVIYMSKAFLPHLLKRPEAHLVNVSSMGGFFPVPGQSLYGASKAAVKLMTEALYSELTDTAVRVTSVLPGAIATNISTNSGVNISAPTDGASRRSFQMATAEHAADVIIESMEANRFQVFIGRDSNMMNLLYRANPRRATRFMYNQMKSLLGS